MAKGDPARGGKGHVTGPCLDTNVSSMNAYTWRPNSVRAQVVIKKKQMKSRGTDLTNSKQIEQPKRTRISNVKSIK